MTKFKMPIREQHSNKGTFGKVLNFCGSENYIGAAYLSTASSLKVGAGYSALATTERVINSVSKILPDAIYCTREEGLKKINDYSAIVLGCGIGLNEDSKILMETVLSQINQNTPIIIDADGLNILAETNYKLNESTIITPHLLEASRLLGVGLNYIQTNLEDTAKALSSKYKCTTVLKSHKTIICNKDLTTSINKHGNSALAKAGSGDVLSGVIAGLIAQKMNIFEACKLGVYLHSRAGEIASEELTEYSVLASDLLKYIHKAIKEII